MWVLIVSCYLIAVLASIAGIQFHINSFRYPFYFSIPLALAVLIPISITFLLPIDYVSSNSNGSLSWFELPHDVILNLWKGNYWSTFLLTWLLLPILQEFYRSGHHNKLSKLKDALRSNLKFQAVMLAVSVIGLIYLLLEVGLSFGHLKSMIIALSHIYALILALWLMAHGLISIPRNRWIEGNVVQSLNHDYLKLPRLVDSLEDVKISFKEEVLQVLVLQKNFTSESPEDFQFRDWILELYDRIPEDLRDLVERQYMHENSSISREQLTIHFMTRLTSNFNSNLNRLVGYESEFDSLLTKITHLEDILSAKSNPNLEERNLLNFRIDNHRVLLSPRLNFIYWYYVRPVSSRIFSVVLFVASFVILQSEFFHSSKFSLMNVLVYSTGINNHSLLQLLVSSITFSYMLFASLNSLTSLKVFNMYHLVPHNSDPVSACFYTTYIARLTIPLSYNFIYLFKSRTSVFETWYGQSIHLTGLFDLMNNWIPRLVLLPVVLTVFHVYDKLKKKIGLNSDLYDSWALFDDDELEGNSTNDIENLNNKRKDVIIVEAKRIVNREMAKRQSRRRDSSNSTNNLRTFNLSQAANTNYENNRRSFHDTLVNSALGNRIDAPYHDDISDTSAQPTMWGRLGGTFSGIRESLARFSGNNNSGSSSNVSGLYRDEPLDDFNYDDDADENVVL
ncbi:predicted protein [Scheffersomyces stipitis CBS 6054]|uniref:Uncharacterized protein n=1 Tax=Scheffersomyces stipitis (strain ATCC 58785 / CBS 6054 / NBRC 10063 / NRRL Y-11545) TaxID=322104 RepID=A3LSI8_PICST|nr:predicted protein [Scheffersomyces stipitis CBS 6054]ABN65574.2 predicted protein [Scheffersomyces stipitis CBS 6054]